MGYTTNVCLVGVSPRGLDLAFLDAGGVGVFDVDSLVVEGWLSCLVVGLVLVAAQGGYFGELILAEIALPGDLYGVVRQVRCQIQPPIEHVAWGIEIGLVGRYEPLNSSRGSQSELAVGSRIADKNLWSGAVSTERERAKDLPCTGDERGHRRG